MFKKPEIQKSKKVIFKIYIEISYIVFLRHKDCC